MKKNVLSALHRKRLRLFLSRNPFYQEMEAFYGQWDFVPYCGLPRLDAIWLIALADIDRLDIFESMGADIDHVFRHLWHLRRPLLRRTGEPATYLLTTWYLLAYGQCAASRRVVRLKNLIYRYACIHWVPGEWKHDVRRARKNVGYKEMKAKSRLTLNELRLDVHGFSDRDNGRTWDDVKDEWAGELRLYVE